MPADRSTARTPPPRRRSAVAGVAAALAVVAVAAVCIRLGYWQLERLQERRSRNHALREALAAPVVELDSAALARIASDPEAFLFRRVRATGHYPARGEVVLRGRSSAGRPGVQLLAPLRLAPGGGAIVVNRGWAPSPDALSVDPGPLAEPGGRVVEGILELFPEGVDDPRALERAVEGGSVVSIQRLDRDFLARRAGLPLPPVLLRQLAGTPPPRGVERLPLPALDEGPHLSYAIQWFSFAAIALGGLGVLILRGRGDAG